MLKTKHKLNFKKTLHIFDKFLLSLITNLYMVIKKTCVAAKILGNLHFLFVFWFPIKF